jgi:TonB family protein
MASAAPQEPLLDADSLIELPPHSRLPRLDLGVEWEPRGEEFRTSLRDFFSGPRATKDGDLPDAPVLRVEWIRGRLPGRAFLVSCAWHVAVIWILVLPIWGFLPATKPTLTPVQIELTWYSPAQDMPPISLHSPAAKPKPRARKPIEPDKTPTQPGADAYHPRQTILSVPVRVTHPRQTLIQPDASQAPPKVAPALPNIVQWASEERPKLQLPLASKALVPRIKRRAVRDVAAPDVGSGKKNPVPLDTVTPTVSQPQLQIPLGGASTAVAKRRATRADAGAAPAPEIGATPAEGEAGLHRVIALSATPAPPAPEVSMPQGNLAAHISISPEGPKPGAPGSLENHSAKARGGSANAGDLPAAVSVSGGRARTGAGGIASARRLILKPMTRYEPPAASRGPVNPAALDPSLPPEKILSGKDVYTMHVNLPNLTSATGSWILSFAQLDEDTRPPFKPKGQLSGPVPYEKVDPKYPPDLIKAHVQGEVVLYAIIRKDGSVDSIQVVRSLDPELDRNAIAALAQWKFRPGTRAGAPVDLEAVVHVPFIYQNPRD